MAALLTLDEAKLHCRIDHDDEDALLGALIATATTAVADYMNVTSVDSTAAAPVKSAALLLVGTLYEHRESVSERPFSKNPAFEALLNPYRVHS
ncbi:head-tail connector protein [Acidovorax sp. LjRoot74]|uniref:head-tail connector protein n=1 Tax=Acidovorax sp. LjRoot74 TaxID=3342337 RepID=UPI003ECEA52E